MHALRYLRAELVLDHVSDQKGLHGLSDVGRDLNVGFQGIAGDLSAGDIIWRNDKILLQFPRYQIGSSLSGLRIGYQIVFFALYIVLENTDLINVPDQAGPLLPGLTDAADQLEN